MWGKEERKYYEKLQDESIKKYEILIRHISELSSEIYEGKLKLRRNLERSIDYYNLFKNTPETMKLDVKKIEIDIKNFTKEVNNLEKEINKIDSNSKKSVTAVVGSSAAVAFLGANAVMAAATTFGVASTGTAVSALSGAAATNAALAWIGGGTLAAGGGGIGLGSVIVGLTGPVGWILGGTGLYMIGKGTKNKNKNFIGEIKKNIIKVNEEIDKNKSLLPLIFELKTELDLASIEVQEHYKVLSSDISIIDYELLSDTQKQILKILVDTIGRHSNLLNKTINVNFIQK